MQTHIYITCGYKHFLTDRRKNLVGGQSTVRVVLDLIDIVCRRRISYMSMPHKVMWIYNLFISCVSSSVQSGWESIVCVSPLIFGIFLELEQLSYALSIPHANTSRNYQPSFPISYHMMWREVLNIMAPLPFALEETHLLTSSKAPAGTGIPVLDYQMSVSSPISCSSLYQPRILDEYVVVHYQQETFTCQQSFQTEDMYTEIPPLLVHT